MIKVILLIFAFISMIYSTPIEDDPCLRVICKIGSICVKSFDGHGNYNCVKEELGTARLDTRSVFHPSYTSGTKIRHSATNVPKTNYYKNYYTNNPCMSSPCKPQEICRNIADNDYFCQHELDRYADTQQARSYQQRKMKQNVWENLQKIFKKQQAFRKLTPLKAIRQKLRDSDYEIIPQETLEEKLGGICVNEKPGTKLINPLRISQYIICLKDEEYLIRNCPRGSVFNTFSEKCERTRDIPNNYLKGNNPCLNKSTFLLLDKYQYRCQCPPGFTGKHCEKEDICGPGFCGENGVCLSIGYEKKVSHMCWCNNGVEIGTDCDDTTKLEPNPCLDTKTSSKYHSLKLKPSVYIECGEENKPMLKTCHFPLIFSEELQECDWMSK